MKITAGIFDIGNVLITWDGKWLNRDVMETLGLNREQFEAAWKPLLPLLDTGKISEKEFWNRFVEAAKPPKPLPQESLMTREFKKRFSPKEDMLALVDSLKSEGINVAVLSNTNEPHISFVKRTGILKRFSVQVFSNEVHIAKPDPEIYEIALERLDVPPSETFLVDDLPENVEAAQKLGLHGLLYKNTEQFKNDLAALGVRV